MNDTKKKLFQEIEDKIARKKKMADKAVERNTIDSFVRSFIDDIDEANLMARSLNDSTGGLWSNLAFRAEEALRTKIRSIDSKCEVEVSWRHQEDSDPQVNGVLIKWSGYHQMLNKVEPELFVDIMSILLRG